MDFTVSKVANLICLTTDDKETLFKSWHEEDFTERKLANAIKKIEKCVTIGTITREF